MKRTTFRLSTELFSAVLTIGLLAGVTFYLTIMHQPLARAVPTIALQTLLILSYLGLFLAATRAHPYTPDMRYRLWLVAAQLPLVIGLYFTAPYGFLAIFMTIWSAQLPYFVPERRAFWLSPLFALPAWLVFEFYWHAPGATISALLFWAFNVFAIMMSAAQMREARARQEAEHANRELKATQALLKVATQQAERSRIARNIHDVLGHHLTALTIHLQVAERHTQGVNSDAHQAVERSYAIAKLLLADVREAVADIRQQDDIPIQQALQQLASATPSATVDIQCDPQLSLNNMYVADAIIRCVQESITNALRHGKASHIAVSLRASLAGLELLVQDNGRGNPSQQGPKTSPGQGLVGMQERAHSIGAEINWQANELGFRTHMLIPLESLQ